MMMEINVSFSDSGSCLESFGLAAAASVTGGEDIGEWKSPQLEGEGSEPGASGIKSGNSKGTFHHRGAASAERERRGIIVAGDVVVCGVNERIGAADL